MKKLLRLLPVLLLSQYAFSQSIPEITFVDSVNGQVTLKWENTSGIPSGGFDIFLNGTDTNSKHRTSSYESTIATKAQCFKIEGRYKDLSPDVYQVSEEKCVGFRKPSIPILKSVEMVNGKVDLIWENSAGIPAGGFDIFIDGVDTNAKFRASALKTTLATDGKCFRIEARYTDNSPNVYHTSEEKCLEIASSIPRIKDLRKIDGKVELIWENLAGIPAGGFDIFIDGIDTNSKFRVTSLNTTLTTNGQCFRVEARYTNKSPDVYLTSEEKCLVPEVQSFEEQLRKGGYHFATDYGAIPNDGIDDTEAIRVAIRSTERLLYFPAGTYDISDTIYWNNSDIEDIIKDTSNITKWRAYLTIWGAGKGKTIFKLKARAPGFIDPTKPKALFHVASLNPTYSKGAGPNGFRNNFRDVSIIIEEGNPGAIAIDYLGNNVCSIRNVDVLARADSGLRAINMERYATGPCFFKNVSITGFDTGIYYHKPEYSLTIENLKLNNQRSRAIHLTDNTLIVRSLDLKGSSPVIEVSGSRGMFILIDSLINSEGSSPKIISKGRLLLQNITSSNNELVIEDMVAKKTTSKNQFEFYTTDALISPNLNSASGFQLPVQETPETPVINSKDWALVDDFGARGGSGVDDWAPIQAALNSGKPVVYLGNKIYYVSKSLVVPPSVKVFYGFESRLRPLKNDIIQGNFFNIQKRTTPLIFENFDIGKNGDDNIAVTWFGDYSESQLVVKDTALRGGTVSYKNLAQSNKNTLFIENVVGSLQYKIEHGMTMIARQLNIESSPIDIINDSSKVLILGYKKEKTSQLLEGKNGSVTEIIGGFIYPLNKITSEPLFKLDSSSTLKASYTTSANQGVKVSEGYRGEFQYHLVSPQGNVEYDQLPRRGYGSVVNLLSK